MVKCQVTSCQKIVSFSDLVKHLKGHIDAGIRIKCPAAGCGREMANKSTFSAHISVKHGNLNKLNINDKMCVSEVTHPASDDVEREESCSIGQESETNSVIEERDLDEDLEGTDPSAFIHNLALFFLKLQCKYFVPSSTVAIIAEELQNLHKISIENMLKLLKSKLLKDNVPVKKISSIVSDIKLNDVLIAAVNSGDGVLRSAYKRSQFYQDKLHYVEPVQKSLGSNGYGKTCFYHYIPVRDTLLAL
jgi:hypothetical protein